MPRCTPRMALFGGLRRRWLATTVVALCALGSGQDAPAQGSPTPSTCAYRDTPVAEVPALRPQVVMATLCLTNHERVQAGLAPLTMDPMLARATQSHTDDMLARGYYDHASPEGCTPTCRASLAGYPGSVGENIYRGPSSAGEAVRGWMASAGHRENILAPEYAVIGVGLTLPPRAARRILTHWAQNFGSLTTIGGPTGLEPEYQGVADPSAARAVKGLTLRGRGGSVSVRARLERYAPGVRRRHDVLIMVRRGARRRAFLRTTSVSGLLSARVALPPGRGRISVTVESGDARRTATIRRA